MWTGFRFPLWTGITTLFKILSGLRIEKLLPREGGSKAVSRFAGRISAVAEFFDILYRKPAPHIDWFGKY